MFRAQLTALLAASVVCVSTLPLQAQTQKTLSDEILPRDTYLYLSFPNVAEMKRQVSASSLGQLWNDPALDDFKAEVNNAIETDLDDGLAKFQEQMGMTLDEFLQIPSGEVSFAFSAGPGNSMGAVLFLDFGESETQVLDILDRGVQLLSYNPRLSREDETFDGTDITLFKIQHKGPSPTPLAEEFGWFIKDQTLVASNQSELLQAVITNWGGDEESFLDNESYAYVLGKCRQADQTTLSTFFVDPVNMFTKLVETQSLGMEATLGAGMVLGALPTLGVTQLKAMGGVTQAGADEFEVVSRSVFFAEQPPAGLMRALQLEQIDQTPPSWVKEDVHAYGAMKWKVNEALESFGSIVDMFSGAGAFADRLDRIADEPPGIHIKHDIVDQLTGEVRLVTAASGNSTGADQMLISMGVQDDDAASDVVARVSDELGLTTRDFRGATIYEQEGPNGQSVSATVDRGRLLICIGGSLLENVLRNDDDIRPLSESADFQKVSQHFPSSALSVQFSRPAEQYRAIYESLRSGTAAEQFPGSQDLVEKIDFTTLPPFDVVADYIRPTGAFSVQDDDGLMMQGFQLKKAN